MRKDAFLNYRKRKRESVLRKMEAMRFAKERKRLARGPGEEEPKMLRSTSLSFGVREVSRVFSVILKEFRPGFPR